MRDNPFSRYRRPVARRVEYTRYGRIAWLEEREGCRVPMRNVEPVPLLLAAALAFAVGIVIVWAITGHVLTPRSFWAAWGG